MDSHIPWYQSSILRQQIVAFVLAALAFFNVQLDLDIDATVAALFSGVGALVALYTIVTRLFKPSPNLTATADAKERELRRDRVIP